MIPCDEPGFSPDTGCYNWNIEGGCGDEEDEDGLE
jgi:hypothetical protein